MFRYTIFFTICISFFNFNGLTATKIKFATVAPEGTTWMKAMREFDKELQKKTKKRVKFIFYAGGVAGDEKDILRKMRYSKIHATGVTGVGMGQILPEARVLDLPFYFNNDSEVDQAHNTLFNHFSEMFLKKGYILIAWSEVGWTYLFSQKPLATFNDYAKLKIWSWEGDPVASQSIKELGVSPTPLSITDVLTSLETGLIDTVYTPPMAAVALQWNTKVKYVLERPIVHSSGAFLITVKQFKKLSAQDQSIFKELGKKHFKKLNKLSRQENVLAFKDMTSKGIIVQTPDSNLKQRLDSVKNLVKEHFKDKLYSSELLNKMESSLQS